MKKLILLLLFSLNLYPYIKGNTIVIEGANVFAQYGGESGGGGSWAGGDGGGDYERNKPRYGCSKGCMACWSDADCNICPNCRDLPDNNTTHCKYGCADCRSNDDCLFCYKCWEFMPPTSTCDYECSNCRSNADCPNCNVCTPWWVIGWRYEEHIVQDGYIKYRECCNIKTNTATGAVLDRDCTQEIIDNDGGSGGGGENPPDPPASGLNFATLARNYPGNLQSQQVYELIGGKVLQNHRQDPINFSNTCALRLSRALNYSGVTIPYVDGQTGSGSDNNWYFYKVEDLKNWLQQKYGQPSLCTQSITLKGIIWFSNCNWNDASGHLDLWNGAGCQNQCHWSECSIVKIWAF